jgi:hypothetical protein
MTGRALRSLVAAAAASLLAAGCGAGAPDGDTSVVNVTAAATVSPSTLDPYGCPTTPVRETVPVDVVPTAVVRCLPDREVVPGDGEWTVNVREQATENLEPLIAALRLRSEPRTNGACTLELREPVEVRLDYDGQLVTVRPPTDECGKTRPEVVAAYGKLRWTEVGRVRVERVRPDAAVASGCEQWKDVLAIEAGTTARPGGPGAVTAPVGEVRVCRYRSAYPPGWTPASNQVVDGEPLDGFAASASQAAEIVAAIGAAGPASACERRHTGFAVVHLGVEQAYVELDGCLRILAPDGTLRQGDADLVTLLATG